MRKVKIESLKKLICSWVGKYFSVILQMVCCVCEQVYCVFVPFLVDAAVSNCGHEVAVFRDTAVSGT